MELDPRQVPNAPFDVVVRQDLEARRLSDVPGVIAPWSSECTSVPELLVSWREWDMCRIEFIEDLPDTDGIIFDVAETGVSVPVQTLIDLARQHGLVLPRSAQGLDH